jgi:hypothetical protein
MSKTCFVSGTHYHVFEPSFTPSITYAVRSRSTNGREDGSLISKTIRSSFRHRSYEGILDAVKGKYGTLAAFLPLRERQVALPNDVPERVVLLMVPSELVAVGVTPAVAPVQPRYFDPKTSVWQSSDPR